MTLQQAKIKLEKAVEIQNTAIKLGKQTYNHVELILNSLINKLEYNEAYQLYAWYNITF